MAAVPAVGLMVCALAATLPSTFLVQPTIAAHAHRLGWSVQVPAGWRVRDVLRASALAPPGMKYDLSRGDAGHLYAVTAVDGLAGPDDSDVPLRLVRTLAHNGWQPLGDPQRETVRRSGRVITVYKWSFRPTRRAAPMETRVYLVPDPESGVTLLLLASSERELIAPLDPDLLQIASTLKFSSRRGLGLAQWTDWGFDREKPPGPGIPGPGDGLADESVPSQQWYFYLRGKRLTPAPGIRETQRGLDLREDGTFQAAGSGKPLVADATVRGRWRIVTRARVTALVLYWQPGEPTYHRLERRGNDILIDDGATSIVRID